jgi:hypothetical protein
MRTRDGLPESADYHDDGCDLHHSCLSCPLPACRYELPPGRARALSQAVALGQLLSSGSTMGEAASELGVSRRTAYRLRRIAPPTPAALLPFTPRPVDWHSDPYVYSRSA